MNETTAQTSQPATDRADAESLEADAATEETSELEAEAATEEIPEAESPAAETIEAKTPAADSHEAEPALSAIPPLGALESDEPEAVKSEASPAEATAGPPEGDSAADPARSKDASSGESKAGPPPAVKPARAEPAATNPKIAALQKTMAEGGTVEGKVIGWNKGGLHVVVDGVTAFCPHSEMEVGAPRAPEGYLDQSYRFRVLKIQKKGKRVVLSRAADLKADRAERRAEIRQRVSDGAIIKGRVASVTDFGAFVDIGGVQGLVHVSEMSRQRVENPHDVLKAGDEVSVKVLKVEQGGRRISLSMKALEPDPWDGVADRFSVGAVVKGTVDKTTTFGAFVLLEPGLTGLLPTSGMNLPRDARPGRVFSPGKELSVQITGVDPRRRRISLALEGSSVEGSRSDYEAFVKGQRQARSGEGFNALAAALQKVRPSAK